MWGGLADEVKLHLVHWKCVCQSIQSGGLGIKKFTSFNTAIWRTVIANKYGIDGVEGGFLKTPYLW